MVPLQIFAPKIVEIEEKKNPIFALRFEEKAILQNPSLQEILNYPQGEIALKWILEKAKRSEANSRRFSRSEKRNATRKTREERFSCYNNPRGKNFFFFLRKIERKREQNSAS